MTRTTRTIAAALGISLLAGVALAAGDARKPERHNWGFASPFGSYDQPALQRGLQVYQEVCAACHGLRLVSFRNLGEEGGPFQEVDGVTYADPNSNPYVLAIAGRYMIEDGPDDLGDMFERPGISADRFPSPYPNEQAARASNAGAFPPDLSVMINARPDGANYVRSLLMGYEDAPDDHEVRLGLYYNPYFPGGLLAMAPPLVDGRLDYADGTEATVDQMASDVTEFLAWAANPHMEARKRLGLMVLIYLSIFAVLMWFAYRQVWSRIEH